MLDVYFGLPVWLSSLLVLGAAAMLSVGGHWAVRRLTRKVPKQETELAVALMGVVAAFIGIMLAFSAVQAWDDYRQAHRAIAEEAAAVSELYRDLSVYGADTTAARAAVRAYAESVVSDEWPKLAHGEQSPRTAQALLNVFREVARIRPSEPRDQVIYTEVFRKLNEVVEHRRARMISARAVLPSLFWVVMLAGSAIMLAYTFVYPATPLNALTIAGLAVSLGLIFMFILDVNHPFAGPYALQPKELRELLPVLAQIPTGP